MHKKERKSKVKKCEKSFKSIALKIVFNKKKFFFSVAKNKLKNYLQESEYTNILHIT